MADVANACAYAGTIIFPAEGFEPFAYLDRAANPPIWTIGHGTTFIDGRPVTKGMVCTGEQADRWARNDMEALGRQVLALVKRTITDKQLGALISLAYNIGIGRLATSDVLEAVNLGLDSAAADRFLEYDHNHAGARLAGLTTRRAKERALYIAGSAIQPRPAAPTAAAPVLSEADRLNDQEISRHKGA